MIKDNVYYEMMSTKNPMNINNMQLVLAKGSGRDFEHNLHWHNALEMTLIRKGAAKYWVNGEEHTVKVGDITFINIGDVHIVQNIDNHSEFESLVILIPDTFILELVSEVEDPYFKVTSTTRKILAMYLEQIALCLENKPPYMNLLIRKQILSIVYLLFKRSYIKRPVPQKISSKKIIDYINKNYSKQLTVKMAAEYMGLQENYFCRYFKQETGITFHRYLSIVRLNAALELLATNQYSELECALAVGFASNKTFIDWCRKIYGCTPLSYVK